MRAIQPTKLLAFLAMILVAAGCATAKRRAAMQPSVPNVGGGAGLPHQMVEVDRNGNRFTNQPTRVEAVDAHSRLIIEFPKRAEIAPAPLSQDWKDLQGVIEMLNQRAAAYRALNERKVDPRDPQAVKQLQKDASDAAANAVSLLDDLEKVGVSGDKLTAVLSGRALGLTNQARQPYLNLAVWATNNWDQLRKQAEAHQKLVESTSKVTVTVQALRESLSGGPSLLHIDDWDTRPEGAFSPIDRTGLRPTDAEQKRLDMERSAAESVAQLINSVQTNQDGFRAAFQTKLAELKAEAGRIQLQFEDLAKNWRSELLPTVLTNLDSLAASTTPGVSDAALSIKTNLLAIGGIVQMITNDVAAAEGLVNLLANPQNVNPLDLLLGNNGVTTTAEKLATDAQTIVQQIQTLPQRIQSIATSLQALAPEVRERVTQMLSDEFKNTLTEFSQKFPADAQSLATIWGIVQSSIGSAAAGEVLAAADTKLIPHTIDNLVPAALDLKKSGLALGDLVTMKLRATNAITGELVESDSYQNEIGFMGLHGKPAIHLIFARSLSGPHTATEWKANVAAAVEWHYTIRRPEDSFGKTWNWLYPGAGIHLASLDQGSDSFELGAGGNVSLWDGLLTGGVGYNFSIKREYVWVGVNLLNLLNTAKSQFITK